MLKDLYRALIVNKSRRHDFWILTAFIVTFAVARGLVRYFPNLFLSANGIHVHHFTYGILILAVVGYIAVNHKGRLPSIFSALYGVGLALAIDETGMWLHLTNQYYNDASTDALILVLAILIFLVYFSGFFAAIIKKIWRTARGI